MSIHVLNKSMPILKVIYVFLGIFLLSTFLLGCFLLTIEADESWNLMSAMKAFGIPVVKTSAIDNPVVTTGGLHFVIHGILSLFHVDIFTHRLISIAFSIILLSSVFNLLNNHIKDTFLAYVGTLIFGFAPGFLLQSSLAMGEIIATTLFLMASLFWIKFGWKSLCSSVLAGTLFGIACATRMTCLTMMPTILIWSFLFNQELHIHKRITYPLITIAISLLTFILFVVAYVYLFFDGSLLWHDFIGVIGGSTGATVGKTGITLLNSLIVSNEILPLFATSSFVYFYVAELQFYGKNSTLIRLSGFVLIAGLLGWLAWILKAPIPHIRYLWPAIPMLWLSAILIGITKLQRINNVTSLVVIHFSVISFCLIQLALNVRTLAVGESLSLVYEFTHNSPLSMPKENLVAQKNQNAIVNAIKLLPENANIYSTSVPAAYPIAYASGHPIQALQTQGKFSDHDFLILLPSEQNQNIWLHSWESRLWIKDNATLIKQYGNYALYKIGNAN